MRGLFNKGWKFLVVGAISTLIELTAFNVFVYALGLDPVLAKVLATGVALFNAYFGNRKWTFASHGSRSRVSEVSLFLAVNLVCLLLGAGIVALGVWIVSNPNPLLLNAINLASIALVVVVRFTLYHSLVFTGEAVPVSAEGRD